MLLDSHLHTIQCTFHLQFPLRRLSSSHQKFVSEVSVNKRLKLSHSSQRGTVTMLKLRTLCRETSSNSKQTDGEQAVDDNNYGIQNFGSEAWRKASKRSASGRTDEMESPVTTNSDSRTGNRSRCSLSLIYGQPLRSLTCIGNNRPLFMVNRVSFSLSQINRFVSFSSVKVARRITAAGRRLL